MLEKDNYFHYADRRTREISFPLGGIGTGCIGLAGNGRLIDWEIYNKPNKLSHNAYTFFAIKAEQQGEVRMAKVLHGDLPPSYMGNGKGVYQGYGYGPGRETLSGLPHYAAAGFVGEYPVATLTFHDPGDPVSIRMTAFNPFIPHNDRDSSIPAAMFLFEVTNTDAEPVEISLAGSLSNPFLEQCVNAYAEGGNGVRSVRVGSLAHQPDSPQYGEIAMSTDSAYTSHQTYWYRGGWFDNLTVFWKDFTAPGRLAERRYDEPRTLNRHVLHEYPNDTATLCSHRRLEPGETAVIRYAITWHFPNCANDWNPPVGGDVPIWTNYYATLFKDSLDSAAYLFAHWERLSRETLEFRDVLFRSSLPVEVVDAVSANLSVLKSPTVLRLTDGTLYGFEGGHANSGSCEGSCTHVWGYEQVTPFLFPSLARSMRELEYRYSQLDDGHMAFRLMLPPERTTAEPLRAGHKPKAAADGQMVLIIRTYREWKLSGDDGWLASLWPGVRRALEYAWHPDNEEGWDRDRDGVMEGTQHHTLDVDMFGPNPFITGLYHAALECGARMAEAMGEDGLAADYRQLLDRGRRWVDEHLFNGDYYIQRIDLSDPRYPLDPELKEVKYQIGGGCHVDQVLGQWHAHVTGIGRIFDRRKTVSALNAIYRHNFIREMRKEPNFCRIYCLNDEQGVMICTWPDGDSPKVPVPYATECMNGFEYQVACHMIYEGMTEEGLSIVRAVRSRYDGERRNPWNEFECGSNYVRSMASYSLLLAMSGCRYDLTQGLIGFAPVRTADNGEFRCLWSVGAGWGEYVQRQDRVELHLYGGELSLNRFASSRIRKPVKRVSLGGRELGARQSGEELELHQPAVLKRDMLLVIEL